MQNRTSELICTQCFKTFDKSTTVQYLQCSVLKCKKCGKTVPVENMLWKQHVCLGGPSNIDMDLCNICFSNNFSKSDIYEDPNESQELRLEMLSYAKFFDQRGMHVFSSILNRTGFLNFVFIYLIIPCFHPLSETSQLCCIVLTTDYQ